MYANQNAHNDNSIMADPLRLLGRLAVAALRLGAFGFGTAVLAKYPHYAWAGNGLILLATGSQAHQSIIDHNATRSNQCPST